jgi:hypothetical protein
MTLDKPASPVAAMTICGIEPPSVAFAAVLERFYGRPGTPEQLEAWRQIGQREWWGLRGATWQEDPCSILINCSGRRGFKTAIDAEIVGYEVAWGEHERHAPPGTRIYFTTVCPDQRQSREAVRAQRAVLERYARFGLTCELRDPSGITEIVVRDPRSSVEKVVTIMTASDTSLRGFAIAVLVLDEFGFFPTEDRLATTDKAILRAGRAAQAQFPAAKLVISSSPGPAEGTFFDMVTKPPAEALLVRAPSWLMNPEISEEHCLKLAGGDQRTFDQEFRARRFGASGEGLLDESIWWACLDAKAERFDYTTAHGHGGPVCAIGADAALQRDSTAFARARCSYVEIPNSSPVVHVFVDLSEEHRAPSRKEPLSLGAIADRLAAIWAQSGKPTIRHDNHMGLVLQEMLKARTGQSSEIVDMTTAAQAVRVTLICQLARSGRLHLSGEGAEELIKQFCGLKVTQTSGGALKVEGRRDDRADAALLAIEEACSGRVIPTGGSNLRRVQPISGFISLQMGVMSGFEPYWVRDLPNGDTIRAAPPVGHADFEDYAVRMLAQGMRTREIDEWLEARPDVARQFAIAGFDRGLNVKVQNG